jgi:hypothetical protein
MLTLKMKPAAATTSVIRQRPFIKNNIMPLSALERGPPALPQAAQV